MTHTIEEFNVDSEAECGQLNLAHVVKKYRGFTSILFPSPWTFCFLACGNITAERQVLL